MYSLLADDSSEHKKAKGVNKSVVSRISHGEYPKVNRIQSKNRRIGTYKINKMSLPWLDYEIPILNNGYNWLALGYLS